MAVASRGGDGPFAGDAARREPSTTFWDYLVSISFALAVLGFALVVWAIVTGRGQDLREQKRRGRLLAGFFIGGLIVGSVLGARFLDLQVPGFRDNGPGASGRPAPARGDRADADEAPYSPELRWPPVVILLGGTAAALVVYRELRRRRKRRGVESRDEELVDALRALLDDTLDDLRAEPDPRRAVIAAYARMERALAGYGLPRRPFEAPLEYLDRIAAPLHAALPSARTLVFELTHLFERAKFSAQAVDVEMKEDAIRTLAALRNELREAEEAA